VRVAGRVQGVGFRYLAAQRARSLGVAGWVRNEPDGTVSAAFEGPLELVQSMLDWCRRGPSGSRVDTVRLAWEQPTGASAFEIRW
jgi:acylphosphatase